MTAATSAVSPVPKIPLSGGLSQALDMARWISAFLVLVTHINNRMFAATHGNVAGHDPLSLGWIFLCGFAHPAVVVFFTLSGFLVGGRVISDHLARQFDTRIYLADRISRIHTVLIPCLLLILLFDTIGMRLAPAIYGGFSLAPATFGGNLVLLQNFFVETYGSDGPLGTLANEFWYYLTFPLIFAPLASRNPRNIAACLAGIFLLVFLGLRQPDHLEGAVLWVLGAVAAALPARPHRGAVQTGLFMLLLVILVAFRIAIRSAVYDAPAGFMDIRSITDTIIALVFSALLYSMRAKTAFRLAPGLARANAVLAGFSYSLYAIHVPTVMLFISISLFTTGTGWHNARNTLFHWVLTVVCILCALSMAFAFSRVTEMNTRHIRRRLRRIFASSDGSPATAAIHLRQG